MSLSKGRWARVRTMNNLLQQMAQEPLTGFSRAVTKINTLWLTLTYPFASIGSGVWIHHACEISRSTAPYISIGNDVMLNRNAWLNVPIPPDGDVPAIILEDRSNIQRGCVISARRQIHVERNTIFGPYVLIMDHNHAFENVTRPIRDQGITEGGRIRIEQGCWIGHGAAIVCNQGELVIGHNSVVAANALVTRSFPPYSVIVGNPGRLARQFDPVKGVWVGGAPRAMASEPR
jgi:carbonic anhydrase/acetyltransferase-like protein (isoleucine patch superfamily)